MGIPATGAHGAHFKREAPIGAFNGLHVLYEESGDEANVRQARGQGELGGSCGRHLEIAGRWEDDAPTDNVIRHQRKQRSNNWRPEHCHLGIRRDEALLRERVPRRSPCKRAPTIHELRRSRSGDLPAAWGALQDGMRDGATVPKRRNASKVGFGIGRLGMQPRAQRSKRWREEPVQHTQLGIDRSHRLVLRSDQRKEA